MESVYRLRSFTAAANEHFVSQPSITIAIRKIEEELGCTLVNRDKKPVTFTNDGEFFMKHVYNILKVINDAELAMKSRLNSNYEYLSIAIASTAGDWLLPQIYSKFHKLYPNCELNITEGTNRDMMKHLLYEEIDLVYSAISSNINPSIFNVIPLSSCTICFLVNKNNPLAKATKLSINDIRNEKILTFPSGSLILSIIDEMARNNHIVLDYQHLSHVSVMETLVNQNYGIATIIRDQQSLPIQDENCICMELTPPVIMKKGFIIKKEHQITPAMEKMIDFVKTISGTI